MNIRQAIELLQKREAEEGSEIELTTLEYNGGDDVPCDVLDFEVDKETGTLRIRTCYRR
jgi:hypothetical protein